ncbi:MAG TPA: T9SS type A sorting domain-containing protein [Bacteroidales bacterium]|nr:T9SS type A sorting domain-containing protein [Bacteroidales bacterium]
MKSQFKHIILFIVAGLVPMISILAQTPELNEEKYWNYRERLRNEFMIGTGPDIGMSIPASVRDTISGILQWTDCTMALGQYIGVLASEYMILASRSEETEETIEELYYALYALNRLDYTAESFFGGSASLNEFFMRDDISEDSLDMDEVLEHLNQGLSGYKISELDSDFMDEIPENNEESLDQAILLITGLVMVRKCVPEDVEYIKENEVQAFQDFETSLSLESANIITRIVNYMKEGDTSTVQLDPGDPNLYGIEGLNWDFLIKNPVTALEVLRGANAFFLSKGFTAAKYHSTGAESPTNDTIYENIADSLFLSFENNIVGNDQDFKVINLNAMANFWPDGILPDTSNADYNARILGPRSQSQGYEWIPMLHQIIFGNENNYLMSQVPPDTAFYNDPEGYYENLLNMAPPEGPYNYGNGNYPNWEWSSTSRTIQPGRRGELSTAFTGNYDGLDYMLYYNMYTLLFEGPLRSQEEKSMEGVNAYPNPFSNILHLQGLKEQAFFEIFNMSGQMVMSGKLMGGTTNSISTHTLPEGLYILSVTDHKNVATKQMIIKNQ